MLRGGGTAGNMGGQAVGRAERRLLARQIGHPSKLLLPGGSLTLSFASKPVVMIIALMTPHVSALRTRGPARARWPSVGASRLLLCRSF